MPQCGCPVRVVIIGCPKARVNLAADEHPCTSAREVLSAVGSIPDDLRLVSRCPHFDLDGSSSNIGASQRTVRKSAAPGQARRRRGASRIRGPARKALPNPAWPTASPKHASRRITSLTRHANAGVHVRNHRRGNEIGVGEHPRDRPRVIPWGSECKCACGDAIPSTVERDSLVVAAARNFGGHGLAAALGACIDDMTVLHDVDTERLILEVAARGRSTERRGPAKTLPANRTNRRGFGRRSGVTG
jgi:hypothetical protein